MILPLAEIVGLLQDGVGHLLREAGLSLMSLVMEEEVRHLAEERTYLYHAVDKVGRTIDFYLSEKRDCRETLPPKAMKGVGAPRVITLDAYAASHRAVKSEECYPSA